MGIASFIQSPWEAPHLDGFSQIYEKRHFSGKWHFSFLFSSKSMNITMGIRMIFFSSFGPTYQSRTIYLRDSGSNPSNLTPLFQNEWDFLAIFGPLVHKGDNEVRDDSGISRKIMGQCYRKPQ